MRPMLQGAKKDRDKIQRYAPREGVRREEVGYKGAPHIIKTSIGVQ